MSLQRRRLMLMQQTKGNEYIQFADAEVERICVANWSSDGVGLTYDDAAKVTDIGTKFRDNSVITSFDEFQYFTSVTNVPYAGFRQCKLMTHITLGDSLVTLNNYAFYRCYALTDLDTNNVTSIGAHAVRECSALTAINAPHATSIGDSALRSNAKLTTIKLPSATSIAQYALYDLKALQVMVLGAATVCTASASGFMANVPTSCKIYVPDSLVDTYKVTSPWSTRASQIYPLSEYTD